MELQTLHNKIYEIDGRQVMLDFDLAALYGVETAQLKRAVRRHFERFEGDDFMFEVPIDRLKSLIISSKCQIGILEPSSEKGKGSNVKYSSLAFTELGVAMLSSVLNSPRAIEINRNIMRAFVSVRNYVAGLSDLTTELTEIKSQIELLRRDGEDTLEDVNDLSEYTRKEIDNLYLAFAALSAKAPELQKPRLVVKGYTSYAEDKK